MDSLAGARSVSIDSFTPPGQQIIAMPLAERERRQAVPRRGMCSIRPANTGPDALISGNGKMYVEVYGDPFSERIVFHHERLTAPWKSEPLEAPMIAPVLPEVRRLILAGKYREANELALSTAAQGRTKPETANLAEHPAFEMRIDTQKQHAVHDYLRTIDFESGEIRVQWADKLGTWIRRTFVSRPDNVVVQIITTPPGATIAAKLSLDTFMVLGGARRPKAPRTLTSRAGMPRPLADPGATEVQFRPTLTQHDIVLQGRYVVDRGTPGYASVTHVVEDQGSVQIEGDSLEIRDAHSVTLVTRISAYDDLSQNDVDALTSAVNGIPADYQALLARHQPGQMNVIDRVSVDFEGAAEHAMSGEEMLTDQRSRPGYNGALLENLFDIGRYWLYLRSGEFPPMWGHVNINVNLQVSLSRKKPVKLGRQGP